MKTATEVDISRAVKIDGWMQEGELQWLAEQALNQTLIVELGSYKGRSTRALIDNTSGDVVAIDDWKGIRGDDNSGIVNAPNLYSIFKENMADVIENTSRLGGKLFPLCLDHAQAEVKNPSMVFIDGSHDYVSVKRDISKWLALLIDGGLLCGHDSGHSPVIKALDETVPGYKLIPKTCIWYYVKAKND